MQAESGLNIGFLLSQIMKSEVLRVTHELQAMKDKIKENSEKIKVNKTLPYLVSNVIEVCVCVWEEEEAGGLETSRDGAHRVECKKQCLSLQRP
jgi:26S proteasome regulatory subunit T5